MKNRILFLRIKTVRTILQSNKHNKIHRKTKRTGNTYINNTLFLF